MIAFLDGDMVVKKNWLESFLTYFNENVVAVMGDNTAPQNIYLNPVEKYYFGYLFLSPPVPMKLRCLRWIT